MYGWWLTAALVCPDSLEHTAIGRHLEGKDVAWKLAPSIPPVSPATPGHSRTCFQIYSFLWAKPPSHTSWPHKAEGVVTQHSFCLQVICPSAKVKQDFFFFSIWFMGQGKKKGCVNKNCRGNYYPSWVLHQRDFKIRSSWTWASPAESVALGYRAES